ncbi:hypothetical protein [Dyadobacter sp. NIV53]|uniref:hypothetical protein n=1 Tax=Dyadobacter sp. NIV53 TaxID=2861765 RepID=UPI001C846137|nr:hypothetical protein [Dyadobacter sp. NIV53]
MHNSKVDGSTGQAYLDSSRYKRKVTIERWWPFYVFRLKGRCVHNSKVDGSTGQALLDSSRYKRKVAIERWWPF